MFRSSSTAKSKPPKKFDEFVINTLISEELSIEGDLIGDGSMRIDGKVKGEIKMTKGLVIGKNGRVSGNITAQSIVVFGEVTGDITCQNLKITSSGAVFGNVETQHITIEFGGKVNGHICIFEGQQQPVLLEQAAG